MAVKVESIKILESADSSSTAEPADRQFFLCCRGSESDQIPSILLAAFKARQEAMPVKPLPSGIEEMMPDYHILVCADGSGTAVRDKFIEEAEMRGLTVNPCSQTGGDKYKGSLIVYTAGPDGSITGRWYREVTPEDVEDLFNECFGFSVMNKEIREQLLRFMRSEDDAPYEDDSP